MEKKSHSLTAAELFEGLQHDTLATVVPVTLTGMVKKSEGKERTIQFASAGNCSGWVTIPLDLIEDVEVLSTVPCKDHTHPLVRLNLKTPTNPEAKIFAALLKGMQSTLEGTRVVYAQQQQGGTDQWGDPICGPGTKKKCYPALCPNPMGPGMIWCTKCQCEVPFNPNPEGIAYYGY